MPSMLARRDLWAHRRALGVIPAETDQSLRQEAGVGEQAEGAAGEGGGGDVGGDGQNIGRSRSF